VANERLTYVVVADHGTTFRQNAEICATKQSLH